MDNPEKREHAAGGYAIIGRFFHEFPDTGSALIRSDRYDLRPGDVLIFPGADDLLIADPVRASQEELEKQPELLEGITHHLLVVFDRKSGELRLSADPRHTQAMYPESPAKDRVGIGEYGRIRYGFILGRDRADAAMMLRELTEQRLKRN